MVIKKHPVPKAVFVLAVLSLLGVSCAANQTDRQPIVNTGERPTSSSVPTRQKPAPSQSSAVLNLSNQGLAKFPMYIVKRTELQELNLAHNSMEGAMPAEIRHLTNLRKLDLSYNQFTGLPAELGQLRNLEELDVSYNSLTGLPYELGNLTNLKRFVLTGNEYSEQDLGVILKTLPKVQIVR